MRPTAERPGSLTGEVEVRVRVVMAAVIAVTAMAWLTIGASAAPPHDGCPVGPGGSGQTINSAWMLMDELALDAAIEAAGGGPNDAAATFAANNRNGDAYLCVLRQVLPNDASGFTTFFVSRDNIANASTG
jgi:hypothetical protein